MYKTQLLLSREVTYCILYLRADPEIDSDPLQIMNNILRGKKLRRSLNDNIFQVDLLVY